MGALCASIPPTPRGRHFQLTGFPRIVNPLQEAAGNAFTHALDNNYLPKQTKVYEDLRDRLAGMLASVGLEPCVPHGGYFIMASTANLPDPLDMPDLKDTEEYRKEKRRDFRIARWLTLEAGVTAIPPSPFVDNADPKAVDAMGGWVRFAFCKSREMIDEAGKRLKEKFGR